MNVGTYKITSGLATSPYFRKLNLYSSGSVSKGMNVVLYETDQSDEQKWYFDGERLYPETDSTHTYCLDRYAASTYLNNADIWEATESDADCQKLSIIPVSADDDYYRIRLNTKVNNEYYYLTAYSNANGTGTGKSTTSAGNVYWAPATGGWNQKWDFSLVGGSSGDNTGGDEEIGGDTGETSDYPEGYYRFSQNTYCLNGTTSALTAVTCNGEKNQTWRYKNGKLYVEANSTYGISGTSTPKMSASPVEIVLEYKTEHTCNIKLKGTDKYLYRSGSTISWSTTEDPWVIERIIKKTGTPRYNPEYFSAMCGETDGSWDGERTDNLKSLFSKIYKNHTGTVADSNIGACLYGAMYGNVVGVKGKFHTGVDINDGSAYNVYEISSPISGYIVNANQSNGSVCVYNNEAGNDYTVVFMHMEIDPDIESVKSTICNQNNWIDADVVLGKQSGYSGGNATAYDSHLHIEIHEGKYTGNGAGLPSKSYEALGSTVSPYVYFADIINY